MQYGVNRCRDALSKVVLSAEQRHGPIVVVELLLVRLLLRRR